MIPSFLPVRGEAAYLVFIMLKAKEICNLIAEVDEAAFISSYALRRDVLNYLHAICAASEKLTSHIKQGLIIPWEILSQIKGLDKQDAKAIWEMANNLIPQLKTAIESLNPRFVSEAFAMESLHLKAGTRIAKGTKLSFFHDEPGLSEKTATEKQEAELAAWLLNRDIVKQWITTSSSLPSNSLHFTGVTSPVLTGDAEVGDVDALLFSTSNISEAVAIECKRIKAVVTNGVAAINGIDNIGKGIRQANALHKLGFFRSWLAIIVIVDGRGEVENNFMFRGLPPKDLSNLFKRTFEYALCGKLKLHDAVGIVFFEVVQAKDKIIEHASFISMCICRDATPIEQPDELSGRINALMKLN